MGAAGVLLLLLLKSKVLTGNWSTHSKIAAACYDQYYLLYITGAAGVLLLLLKSKVLTENWSNKMQLTKLVKLKGQPTLRYLQYIVIFTTLFDFFPNFSWKAFYC